MSTLDESISSPYDAALDVIEQTLLAADWVCERGDEGAIHCGTMTSWGECGGLFSWRDEPASIHFSLTLDLRSPANRKTAIWELLCKINERLWLGHFDYWAEEGVAIFRHTIPMLDRDAPEAGEIAAVIAAALDAANQFLPAFNFVAWAGKSPSEAIDAALFETAGEA